MVKLKPKGQSEVLRITQLVHAMLRWNFSVQSLDGSFLIACTVLEAGQRENKDLGPPWVQPWYNMGMKRSESLVLRFGQQLDEAYEANMNLVFRANCVWWGGGGKRGEKGGDMQESLYVCVYVWETERWIPFAIVCLCNSFLWTKCHFAVLTRLCDSALCTCAFNKCSPWGFPISSLPPGPYSQWESQHTSDTLWPRQALQVLAVSAGSPRASLFLTGTSGLDWAELVSDDQC